jgi:hypothetical protein
MQHHAGDVISLRHIPGKFPDAPNEMIEQSACRLPRVASLPYRIRRPLEAK